MKPFRSFPIFLLLSSLGYAQTAPAKSVSDHDEPLALEAMVVSAGPDAKSAFDLAQGTSVLVSDQLRRSALATLGDTLAATPGVNATYYGPGASRPIIRGLGGDRVRMLDNGVGSLDASNVSPDHNVSVEPLLVDRIEVLRGPATLLYGSSAVGGVVNVIDNRIPSAAPEHPISGRTEFRFDSAANERTGVLAVTAGGPAFAVQLNGLRTATDDVSIPGYADPANPADRGTLVNSAISTKKFSLGGTRFGESGSLGVAVSEYDTVYGVPVGEPINIDMQQRRADLRAERTRSFGIFKSARFRLGLADYRHAEVDATTGRPNTTFKNKAYEGRLELIQQDAGDLTRPGPISRCSSAAAMNSRASSSAKSIRCCPPIPVIPPSPVSSAPTAASACRLARFIIRPRTTRSVSRWPIPSACPWPRRCSPTARTAAPARMKSALPAWAGRPRSAWTSPCANGRALSPARSVSS